MATAMTETVAMTLPKPKRLTKATIMMQPIQKHTTARAKNIPRPMSAPCTAKAAGVKNLATARCAEWIMLPRRSMSRMGIRIDYIGLGFGLVLPQRGHFVVRTTGFVSIYCQ